MASTTGYRSNANYCVSHCQSKVALDLTPANSLFDLRRQCELPSPSDLKDFVSNRKQSWLEKERRTWDCQSCNCSPKTTAYKNLFGVSVSYLLNFGVYLSVISLQSSLNEEDGLGLISLIVVYIFFILSGVFTSAITSFIGTKYSLVMGYTVLLIYTLSNFYPHWYTLIPGSVLLGLAFGPMWAALNIHVTTVARRYAPDLNDSPDYLIALFIGIFTLFYKIAYIPGNLASSIIFFSSRVPGNSSDGETFIDSSLTNICNNTEAANVDKVYVYILFSIFVFLDLLAIIICLSFIDHLGTNTRFFSFGKMVSVYLRKPVVGTLKMFLNWKMLLILPMMILSGFMMAFNLGQLTKFYVSDCIGVQWIGIVLIVFGIFSGFVAVSNGRLVKCVPQYVMVYMMMVTLSGVYLFLVFWERVPSFLVVFSIIALFGMCDGIASSVPPSLVGILFIKNQQSAYGALRIGLAFGYLFGFITSQFFHIKVQLYVALFLVFCSFCTFSVLVVTTNSKEDLVALELKKKGTTTSNIEIK